MTRSPVRTARGGQPHDRPTGAMPGEDIQSRTEVVEDVVEVIGHPPGSEALRPNPERS